MKKVCYLAVALSVVMMGCGVKYPEYQPPTPLSYNAENVKTINKNFEQTWTALIDYASSSFFAIDNFEKDSGLMTLNFGSNDPAKFVDCGTVHSVAVKYDGPFIEGVQSYGSVILEGRMNLFVKSIAPNVTSVKIKARYVLTAQEPGAKQIWAFDTGGSDAKKMGGIQTNVVCRPTNYAEEEILKGIEKISKGIPIK